MIKKKRIVALLLALIMALSTVVSAYALQVWVRYKQYVYSSQITFYKYDYSKSTSPSIQRLTILADSSLGSGSALYHVKEVDGEYGYCIQPGVRSDDSSNYQEGSSASWYNLPAAVQSGIAMALACGFPEANYGTASGDYNSSSIIIAEKWAATQCVIWELICDYIDPYDYTGGYSPFYYCVNTSNYPTFKLWYQNILSAMQDSLEIPSFAQKYSGKCTPIELAYNASSGNYSVTLTDTNGVLSYFPFNNCSGNGITFTQSKNTLTITATAAAAENLTSAQTFSTTGSAFEMDPNEAVLCYYDKTGTYQALANATGVGQDPVKAYIKLIVPAPTGSLTITKTDAENGAALSGITYRLYNSSGAIVSDAVTDSDGKAVFSNLALGSYSYQEIAAKDGYILDNTKYSISISSDALNVSQSRTNTPMKGSITISKVDADTKAALAGVTFRLCNSTGTQVGEAKTDASGKVAFTNLRVGNYTYQEITTLDGYVLDSTVYNAAVTSSVLNYTVTRENSPVKGSLVITKVDAESKTPLAGVTFRLFDSAGTTLKDSITDANGKVAFDDLRLGNYTYQEIATLDGYQLDNTKHDFSLTSTNVNVTATVENSKKPASITIHKVDAGGTPLQGVTLLLEKSEDNGTTWTAVESKTTGADGIAKWTDLAAKTTVQYRITETDTASGYSLLAEPLAVGALPHGDVYDVSITICNTQNLQLPFTGGNGFSIPILFAALALMAGVFYCKKSIYNKENN